MIPSIDRRALVERHAIKILKPDPQHVLTVGNGDFAYTADITGMQTFEDFHDQVDAYKRGETGINTSTMTNWGWHEMPNPDNFVLEDAMSEHPSSRGPVLYPDQYDMMAAMSGEIGEELRAGSWLHANPQRMDLGRIGLALRSESGGDPISDPHLLETPHQTLDLWNGRIESSFIFGGEQVSVETVSSPVASTVAFRIRSVILADQRLAVTFSFPYASDGFFQTDDWSSPGLHQSSLNTLDNGRASITRDVDNLRYFVAASFSSGELRATSDPHRFELTTSEPEFELVVSFARDDIVAEHPTFSEINARASISWKTFWLSGAAIDLSASADPRAPELERRLVLSQYLTAVNGSGTLPPQETGLITNSWQGKFHLEMHWWHAAHFATWGRPELLEKSLAWYRQILPVAQATAIRQGYKGARWPKHVGPDGRESPSPIGSLLIWQQPHLLYLLELVWQASNDEHREHLQEGFSELLDETAIFMADFVELREDGRFHLPSPLVPAQEFYGADDTDDPTFELAYWWWGLEIAQRWRERKGLERHPTWSDIQNNMASPPQLDDCYVAVGREPFLRRDDHPSLVAALGFVPHSPIIDPAVMDATLADVMGNWEWSSAWGWDFPMLAMTATRLGNLGLALDLLMQDEAKNTYTLVGHNPQMASVLPLYLPGNGALLAAMSMIVSAATDDQVLPQGWSVRAEGFVAWPNGQ
jgi:hypothetical protein